MDQLKPCTVLLADADVLIDYRDTDVAMLKLVGQHVGSVAVLSPVLDEVRGLSRRDCVRLSISVVDVDTRRLLQAGVLETSVSFNDRLCFLVCRDEDWTCVTNDGALRRLCERHDVRTRYGLGLVVDLVAVTALTRGRALAIASKMQESNPLHINERSALSASPGRPQ